VKVPVKVAVKVPVKVAVKVPVKVAVKVAVKVPVKVPVKALHLAMNHQVLSGCTRYRMCMSLLVPSDVLPQL